MKNYVIEVLAIPKVQEAVMHGGFSNHVIQAKNVTEALQKMEHQFQSNDQFKIEKRLLGIF